ncbi:MAG: S8 family serine peptidase [Saprospiraceae bacterium]|nr:S8 family serine peptidase [Saprospiraceae bacterium]MCB9328232.1 S8 family serine peptidase [Lewinellaceae bacterium]
MKHHVIVVILLGILYTPLTSQKLNHRLGEFIVMADSDRDIETACQKYKKYNNRSTAIGHRLLIEKPFRLYLISVDYNTINENELRDAISKENGIHWTQKNHIIHERNTPNDPRYIDQWQYPQLEMDKAWNYTTGGYTSAGDTVVVAVVDDGFLLTHTDLIPNLWKNHAELPDNGIDDDNNGYIDDYEGWSATSNSDNLATGHHGGAVCGIIGAKGNNNLGVAGMNWNVKLMPIEYGSANEANALISYSYAYNMRKDYNDSNGAHGAFVVATNSSWGIDKGLAEDAPIWCNMYDALGEVGIISCGATANLNLNVEEAGDLPTQCNSNYLIGVTNLNMNDLKVNSAGYGYKSIDLGAYGDGTFTVSTSNNYGPFSGTSGATPHVTGLAALIYASACEEFIALSKSDPARAAIAVKDFILNGTVSLNSLAGITTSGGKLNGYKSMQQVTSLCENKTVPYAFEFSSDNNNNLVTNWLGGKNTTIDVRYRAEGTSSWTTKSNINTPYTFNSLPLCESYEIQFRSSFDNKWGYSRFLETGGCCVLPKTVSLTDQNGKIKVNISFEPNTSDVDLMYRQIGNTEWTTVNLTGTEFLTEYYQPCRSYEFRLVSNCNKTSNSSELSDTYIFNPECDDCTEVNYCTLFYKNNYYEWIESFGIGNSVNISGQNRLGYGQYTNVFSDELIPGNSYSISMNPGYSDGTYKEYFRVFIDYGRDGSFDQSEDLAFDAGTTTQEGINGTINILSSATEGYTRMRVIMSFLKSADPCDAAASDFEDGEYEDYCVYIGQSACTRPYDLKVGNLTQSSFSLSWASVASDYNITVTNTKNGETQNYQSEIESLEINNLQKCVTYKITISSLCGNVSNESESFYVTTKCSSGTVNVFNNDFKVNKVFSNGDNVVAVYNSDKNYKINTRIFSINGTLISSYEFIAALGQNTITLNESSSLSNGIYLITFDNGTHLVTKRFIKIN